MEEQWSHVLSDFNKKASIDMYIEESRDCEKNPFLLERRSGLAKMLKREAELENHPIIKDIYEKYICIQSTIIHDDPFLVRRIVLMIFVEVSVWLQTNLLN